MDLYKAEDINKEILDKATVKLENSLSRGDWDEEVFKAMSQSLDNLKDITKINYNLERKEVAEVKNLRRTPYEVAGEETEFESIVYTLMDKKPIKELMGALMSILTDYLEDTRIMHPKAYENIILKLKEML